MSRTFRLPAEAPLFDLVSYGRGGPGRTDRLTPAQIEQVRLTVNRAPEVMVKVLPRSSNDLKAVGRHVDYISRHGKLELETDDGHRPTGKESGALLDDWDLDIDDLRRQPKLAATKGRPPPKLVHKLMFSMPAGTPPDKVLGAVRNLAREQFWGQHRYAFVLHTDEDHPHVHLVLKAVSEQGERLNIKKATLRHWRAEFARHLRLLGVAANATERAVRGQTKKAKKDGIFRASRRGESTHVRAQVEAVAKQISAGPLQAEASSRVLITTRNEVVRGWRSTADKLAHQGEHELASRIQSFVREMPLPQTDKQWLAHQLVERTRAQRIPDRRLVP